MIEQIPNPNHILSQVLWTCWVAIPAWFIGYANDCPINSFTPATVPSDLYVHAMFETNTGNGYDVFTGAIFTGATGWVLATDTANIQIAVDQALLAWWYTVWMAIYTYDVSTNEIIIYQDPSIPVGYFELWAGWDFNPWTYTNKCKFWTIAIGIGATWEKVLRVAIECDNTAKTYNDNRHIEVLPWTPYIATGENSVTVLVKWVVNITIDWVTITYDTWDTISFDASSLLINDITIDAISWRAIVLLLK